MEKDPDKVNLLVVLCIQNLIYAGKAVRLLHNTHVVLYFLNFGAIIEHKAKVVFYA